MGLEPSKAFDDKVMNRAFRSPLQESRDSRLLSGHFVNRPQRESKVDLHVAQFKFLFCHFCLLFVRAMVPAMVQANHAFQAKHC